MVKHLWFQRLRMFYFTINTFPYIISSWHIRQRRLKSQCPIFIGYHSWRHLWRELTVVKAPCKFWYRITPCNITPPCSRICFVNSVRSNYWNVCWSDWNIRRISFLVLYKINQNIVFGHALGNESLFDLTSYFSNWYNFLVINW